MKFSLLSLVAACAVASTSVLGVDARRSHLMAYGDATTGLASNNTVNGTYCYTNFIYNLTGQFNFTICNTTTVLANHTALYNVSTTLTNETLYNNVVQNFSQPAGYAITSTGSSPSSANQTISGIGGQTPVNVITPSSSSSTGSSAAAAASSTGTAAQPSSSTASSSSSTCMFSLLASALQPAAMVAEHCSASYWSTLPADQAGRTPPLHQLVISIT